MSNHFRIAITIISILFLAIGLAGMFRPADLAEVLGLGGVTGEAAGSIRAMIGAHYIAMGIVCLLAVVRQAPAWLFPIGMIEALMVVARMVAAINGEFTSSTVGPTIIESIVAALLLSASRKLE